MSKLRLPIVAAAIFAAAPFTSAQTAGGPPAGCPDPSKCPVSRRVEDIKWEKAFPDLGADGPDLAVVHVNPKTHATQLLIRATKQAVVPWHWHTANEAITVVQGTFTVECEGKKTDLAPGSFTYTPDPPGHVQRRLHDRDQRRRIVRHQLGGRAAHGKEAGRGGDPGAGRLRAGPARDRGCPDRGDRGRRRGAAG
jgi:quercetin dioxygenase-like cupin family protein